MIIECWSCSSRFRLDEMLLKPSGSRVRCSKCKLVFLLYPPEGEPSAEKASGSAGGIVSFDRRKSLRFPVSIPVLCSSIDQNGHESDVHIGAIKQISREGAAVEIFECDLSGRVNLSFIGENDKDVQAKARVRHSSTDRWGKMKIGLSLEGSIEKISHFYQQALREKGEPHAEARPLSDTNTTS